MAAESSSDSVSDDVLALVETPENGSNESANSVLRRSVPNLARCTAPVYELFEWSDQIRLWKCKLCP